MIGFRLSFLMLVLLNSGMMHAQHTHIDQQYVKDAHLFLVGNYTHLGERHTLSLIKTDRNYQDTNIYHLDSIDVIPCGHINSMHFVNENLGFITESGGCYAHYNYLFRTEDGGKTWQNVEKHIGNEFEPVLDRDHFFMFDEQKGIIIWKAEKQQVYYSTSSDGGKTWKAHTTKLEMENADVYLTDLHFSNDGQIILLVGNDNRYNNLNQRKQTVYESNDFGETYRKLQ